MLKIGLVQTPRCNLHSRSCKRVGHLECPRRVKEMCGFKGDLQEDKTFEETNAYAFKSQAEARCRNSRHLRAVNRES